MNSYCGMSSSSSYNNLSNSSQHDVRIRNNSHTNDSPRRSPPQHQIHKLQPSPGTTGYRREGPSLSRRNSRKKLSSKVLTFSSVTSMINAGDEVIHGKQHQHARRKKLQLTLPRPIALKKKKNRKMRCHSCPLIKIFLDTQTHFLENTYGFLQVHRSKSKKPSILCFDPSVTGGQESSQSNRITQRSNSIVHYLQKQQQQQQVNHGGRGSIFINRNANTPSNSAALEIANLRRKSCESMNDGKNTYLIRHANLVVPVMMHVIRKKAAEEHQRLQQYSQIQSSMMTMSLRVQPPFRNNQNDLPAIRITTTPSRSNLASEAGSPAVFNKKDLYLNLPSSPNKNQDDPNNSSSRQYAARTADRFRRRLTITHGQPLPQLEGKSILDGIPYFEMIKEMVSGTTIAANDEQPIKEQSQQQSQQAQRQSPPLVLRQSQKLQQQQQQQQQLVLVETQSQQAAAQQSIKDPIDIIHSMDNQQETLQSKSLQPQVQHSVSPRERLSSEGNETRMRIRHISRTDYQSRDIKSNIKYLESLLKQIPAKGTSTKSSSSSSPQVFQQNTQNSPLRHAGSSPFANSRSFNKHAATLPPSTLQSVGNTARSLRQLSYQKRFTQSGIIVDDRRNSSRFETDKSVLLQDSPVLSRPKLTQIFSKSSNCSSSTTIKNGCKQSSPTQLSQPTGSDKEKFRNTYFQRSTFWQSQPLPPQHRKATALRKYSSGSLLSKQMQYAASKKSNTSMETISYPYRFDEADECDEMVI